jgi:hypothetical protein
MEQQSDPVFQIRRRHDKGLKRIDKITGCCSALEQRRGAIAGKKIEAALFAAGHECSMCRDRLDATVAD